MRESFYIIGVMMVVGLLAQRLVTVLPMEISIELIPREVERETESHTGGEETEPVIPDQTLAFPVAAEDYRITSQKGLRWSNRLNMWAEHQGVDIAPVEGSKLIPEVVSVAAGKVLHHYFDDPIGGEYYVIDHGWGLSTYMHLGDGYVTERQPDGSVTEVVAGQKLGPMGDTGESDGIHLHLKLELLINGEYVLVDPLPYLEEVLLSELQPQIAVGSMMR